MKRIICLLLACLLLMPAVSPARAETSASSIRVLLRLLSLGDRAGIDTVPEAPAIAE